MYRCERAEMRGARSGRARRMMEFIFEEDSSGLGRGESDECCLERIGGCCDE